MRSIWNAKSTLITLLATCLAIAVLAIMTNCAMLQKRAHDPNAWIQINPPELMFTAGVTPDTPVFAKVEKGEKETIAKILVVNESSMTILAVIIDVESDGSVAEAFVVSGEYNPNTEVSPFSPRIPPQRVHPSFYNRVTQDYNTILELWKTRKRVSHPEMDNIVKKFLGMETSASSNNEPI